MWIAAITYSAAWGFGLVIAYNDYNLKNLDIIMTVFFFLYLILFLYLYSKL